MITKIIQVGELLEEKDSPIVNIKRFLSLFLLDEKELLNFVMVIQPIIVFLKLLSEK